eukprot:gene9849-10894_t
MCLPVFRELRAFSGTISDMLCICMFAIGSHLFALPDTSSNGGEIESAAGIDRFLCPRPLSHGY